MAETPGPSEGSSGSEGAGVPPPSQPPVTGSNSQPVPGPRPNAASGMPGNPWMYSGGGTVPGYYTPPAPKPVAAGGAASGAAASTASKAGAETKPAEGSGKKTDAKKGDGGGGDASLASVIDTIEAIIIALIVALTFRAFIVEAFRDPDGVDGADAFGAHYKVICPKCGYEYDLETPLSEQTAMDTAGHHRVPNAQFRELGPNRMVPTPGQDTPAYCPNCRYPISAAELPQYIETAQTFYDNGKAPGKRPYVWANNGDRILVLKYLYAVMEPHHWDVIVFKEPQDAQDNYIKRLIALPGETVQVIGGDVYINPKGKPDAKDAVISRKPEELQQSLWQLVYDNSYYPVDEGVTPRFNTKEADGDVNRNVVYDSGPWINPWEPAAGSEKDWKKGPAMTYAGGGEGSLIFHQIPPGLPAVVARNYPPYGLNTLGYNNDFYVDDTSPSSGEFAPRSVVGDLRLETVWTPKGSGAASIKLILGRPNNCYRVTWSDKGLTLERYAPEPKNPDRWSFGPVTQINLTSRAHEAAEPNLAASIPVPVAGKTYQLAFDNVDRSVRFYIDGKKVLWFEENWNADLATEDAEKYPADWSNSQQLAESLRLKQQDRVNTMIEVDMGGPGTLSHLKVLRDLYYTQTTPQWALQYQPGTATQGHRLTLGEDEFFAMGDNSRKSSDGRLWNRVYPPLGDLGLRPGIVPRRYLLGKAFFVYWPAGFTPAKDVPVLRDLPLVPNMGDMRVIR